MAHTIRGFTNILHKKGFILYLQIIRDNNNLIFRHEPSKSSILNAKPMDKIENLPYTPIFAKIHLRKEASHHLSRLCVAHELYHLWLLVERFTDANRKEWDNEIKEGDEESCNEFAKQLCKKHNEFNKDEGLRGEKIEFPSDILDNEFILDLGNFGNLPKSLR